tara:strand:+ start:1201 stop:2217 length:1017 start_codon:yes stop_codon:yes gene_type:complete
MKAAVLEKIDHPLSILDVGCTELRIGQVLVKNIVSGICGSQLHEIRGYKNNRKFLPHLMGHEGCGIVEDIGEGVTTVSVGDKVVMHWRQGLGIESDFPQYILNDAVITSGKVTTLSEYSIVSENRLTSVDKDTPSELCAILGCALTTAMGIIDNEIDLKFGESLAVIGCGGIGLNLIQAASMKNAFPIIAVDKNINKKDLCIKSNASQFINDINDYSQGKIDVIIDTTGIPDVITDAINKLSDQGRMILVGQPAPDKFVQISNALNLFNGIGKTIKATQGGKTRPEVDIPRYVKLYLNYRLKIDHLFTHRFPLVDVNKGFDLLRSGNAGRVIVSINEK